MRRVFLCPLFLLLLAHTAAAQQRSGKVTGVWWEEGKREHEYGIWLKVSFQVNNAYAQRCTIVAYFHDKDRKPLPDLNKEYYTADNKVSTMEDFTPSFRYAKYTKYRMFLPYNEFHLPRGNHSLTFKFSFFWRGRNNAWNHIASSGFYRLPLNWSIAETGEIKNVRTEYNYKRQGSNGVQLTIDYSVHNAKGLSGRFIFEFYYDLENLTVLYESGRRDKPKMTYTQNYVCKWVNTDFNGGKYWVPYSIFPLKIGKNTFFHKIWLQIKRNDGKWYTLDATRASEFYVNNGKLNLKEAWVVPEWRVELDWNPTAAERRVLSECLRDMNRRLYDTFDGQVRIARFVIGRKARVHNHRVSAFRIYKDYQRGDHGDQSGWRKWIPGMVKQMRAFAGGYGTPDSPFDAHIPYSLIAAQGAKNYSRVLAHEFLHCAFGLIDEYDDQKDPNTGRVYSRIFCSGSEQSRRAWNTCVMGASQPLYREMCKPGTHIKTHTSKKWRETDCYTLCRRALWKAFRKTLVIPQTPVEGPALTRKTILQWEF